MQIGEILGIAAVLVHTIAYLDYNMDIFMGRRKPNVSTWVIWAVIGTLSASSYHVVTDDWAKSTLSVVNLALCVITLGFIFAFSRSLKRPDKWDFLALALGLSAGGIWWFYKSAMYANMAVILAFTIGFIPTFRTTWNCPTRERPSPWFIWTLGYVVLASTVIARWKGQWYDLAYPTSCIMLHLAIALISKLRLRYFIREHKQALQLVSPKEVYSLTDESSPESAAELILEIYDDARACALIDKLDEVLASLVLAAMHIKAKYSDSKEYRAQARRIIGRCEALVTKGSRGPIYARDEHYWRTSQLYV